MRGVTDLGDDRITPGCAAALVGASVRACVEGDAARPVARVVVTEAGVLADGRVLALTLDTDPRDDPARFADWAADAPDDPASLAVGFMVKAASRFGGPSSDVRLIEQVTLWYVWHAPAVPS